MWTGLHRFGPHRFGPHRFGPVFRESKKGRTGYGYGLWPLGSKDGTRLDFQTLGVRTSDIKDDEVLRPRNRAGTNVPVVAQLNVQAQSRKWCLFKEFAIPFLYECKVLVRDKCEALDVTHLDSMKFWPSVLQQQTILANQPTTVPTVPASERSTHLKTYGAWFLIFLKVAGTSSVLTLVPVWPYKYEAHKE